MKRIIFLLSIIAATSQAQVTNTVNISNSLLGPVTNVFTNTQVNVGEAIITGAVFNASVSNTFSPTLVTTNIFNVGTVSVSNDISNVTYVTNIVENIAVSTSNNITINDPTTFITANHTSTPQSVRIWGGTNLATSVVAGANMDIYVEGGGGGAALELYTNGTLVGTITNGINLDASMFGSITGGRATFGFSSAQFPTNLIGSNRVIIGYSGSQAPFEVPNGISNIVVWLWGAGGGGGSGGQATAGGGGYTQSYIPVVPLEILTLEVGGGGTVSSTSTTYSVAPGGWPRGGEGVSRKTHRAGSGGGWSSIWRGTNILAVAGGGGGSSGQASITGGSGGGLIGSSGGAGISATGGGAGTQTEGGTTGISTVPLAWTNTAGGFGIGGSGGVTTNDIAVSSGGGGQGYFGGGGGLTATTTDRGAGGGGGSGFNNKAFGAIGFTIRAVGATPAGQEIDGYISGAGVGGAAATAGGNGLIIIGY